MCLNSTRNISFRLVIQRLELNELQVTQTCFLSALLNQYPIKPSIWLRYIDDIITMWNESEDKLKNFFTYFNMIKPAIQFTQAYSFKSVNFLDALVTLTADATPYHRVFNQVAPYIPFQLAREGYQLGRTYLHGRVNHFARGDNTVSNINPVFNTPRQENMVRRQGY